MSNQPATLLIAAFVVLAANATPVAHASTLGATTWNETVDGGGDAGIQTAPQITSGNTPLTTISGALNQVGGDHVDCYQIHVTDADNFRVTSDPAVDPAAVVGETDTRLFLFAVDGTPISVNDDTPDQPGGADTPGLLSMLAQPTTGTPPYVVAPINPVTTAVVNGTNYVICYTYFPNDPDAAGGLDMLPIGTAFEGLNGPNPAATPFVAWENTGTDAAAAYTIAVRGIGTADLPVDLMQFSID